MPKKGKKSEEKNIYFGLNKYQSVTHFSTCIFQGLKNIIFRSVALVTKKLCAILDFFSSKDRTFFSRPVQNAMH